MRIAIEHRIEYSYSIPASYAIQHLRMTPRSTNTQRVQRWYVTAGRQDRFIEFFDCFGNPVWEAIQIEPHESLKIEATGVVETFPNDGITSGQDEVLPLFHYLAETALTEIGDDVLDLASGVRSAALKEQIDGLHRLMATVGDSMTYTLDHLEAQVPAGEALQRAAGAASDHAHVFIACARSLGIPSRMVTGYRLPDEDDEGPVESGYAWAESWVDGFGWVGFDAAHQVCPAERYVRMSCGADYLAAAPVRQSLRGGGEETASVDISVSQVQQQQ